MEPHAVESIWDGFETASDGLSISDASLEVESITVFAHVPKPPKTSLVSRFYYFFASPFPLSFHLRFFIIKSW